MKREQESGVPQVKCSNVAITIPWCSYRNNKATYQDVLKIHWGEQQVGGLQHIVEALAVGLRHQLIKFLAFGLMEARGVCLLIPKRTLPDSQRILGQTQRWEWMANERSKDSSPSSASQLFTLMKFYLANQPWRILNHKYGIPLIPWELQFSKIGNK